MGFPKKYLSSLLVMFTIFAVGIIPMVRWLDTAGAALTLDLMMVIGTGVIYYHTRTLLSVRLLRGTAPTLLAAGVGLLALLLLKACPDHIREQLAQALALGIPHFLGCYGLGPILMEAQDT